MAYDPADDTYLEYWSSSGSIVCRVICPLGPMVFVQFRTRDWEDFGNYTRVALFPEHLRPADPQSPGVAGWLEALAKETAAAQQSLANCRHRGGPSGNGSA